MRKSKMKDKLKYIFKQVKTGAIAGLTLAVLATLSGGKKRSEPIIKQIGSNDARMYYAKWSQEIDGKENLDPIATFIYVDEKPYGNLDYVLKLEKRGEYNRATIAWSPSQEDINNFTRIVK
jgi:hypothetical protein